MLIMSRKLVLMLLLQTDYTGKMQLGITALMAKLKIIKPVNCG